MKIQYPLKQNRFAFLVESSARRAALFLLLIFAGASQLSASNYYWVGGSGNWNDMGHWAATTGGAAYAYIQAPTQNDDVFFDQNSFPSPSGIVTINVAAVCRNFDMTGATASYSGATGPRINNTVQFNVLGNFILAPNMNPLGAGAVYGQPVTFSENGATYNIDIKANIITAGLTFDALGANFQLLSAIAGTSVLTVNRGSVNTNGNSVTATRIVIASNGITRALNATGSLLTLTGGADVFTSASTLAADPTLSINLANTTFVLPGISQSMDLEDYTFNKIWVYSSGSDVFTAASAQTATIYDLHFYGGCSATFAGNIFILDSMLCHPGASYGLGNALTFGSLGVLAATGTCSQRISLLASLADPTGATTSGLVTAVSGWSAATPVSSCNIGGLTFSGGGVLATTQSYNVGNNNHVNFPASAPAIFYWIGRTGKWNNGNNWALSSGGAAVGCIPGPQDSVVFDANSFTTAGQIVSLFDSASTYCGGMSWTGVPPLLAPIFQNTVSPLAGTSLVVNGCLAGNQYMSWKVSSPVYFTGPGAEAIASAGDIFQNDVYINSGGGSYSLNDSLQVKGYLHVNEGTLITNNYSLHTQGMISTGSLTRALQLGTSTWWINIATNAVLYGYYLTGSNYSVAAANSTIHITGSVATYGDFNNFGDNQTYGSVLLESSAFAASASAYVTGANNVYNRLRAEVGMTFNSSMTIQSSLELGSNTYQFFVGSTCTLQGAANLIQIGSSPCQGPTLQGLYGQASIAKSSAAVTLNNATLLNIKGAGGAAFNAYTSTNLGGNTGWTFTVNSARTLYWVGGTGDWSDPNHWSSTSGGAPGECPPTTLDSLLFDANSFTGTGQKVTINQVTTACKAMNWTGVTNHPALADSNGVTMTINGSLLLDPGMQVISLPALNLSGTAADQPIITGGNVLGYTTIAAGTGSYAFSDFFQASVLALSSGMLNANNNNVTIGYFSATSGVPCILNMGAGLWTVTSHDSYINSWYVTNGYLTVNAGTSSVLITAAVSFFTGGSSNTYNVVDGGASQAYFFSGNFQILRAGKPGGGFGTIQILDSLRLVPGGVYSFTAGGTVSLANAAVFDAKGLAAQMITIQSATPGTQFNLVKNTGLVCTDFLNLYDSYASGGAIFTAGANSIDRGDNNGWDFTPYPAAGNGSLSGGTKCASSPYMLRFDITAGAFPMDIVVEDLNTGGTDTLYGVTASPVYFPVSPTATHNFQVQSITVQRCSKVVTGPFNTVTVTVLTGPHGSWTDAAGDNDWFNCLNWGDGFVPDNTTDVIVNGSPVINGPGALTRNLTIQSGSSVTLSNPNASLAIAGQILNSGQMNSSIGKVIFNGTVPQAIPSTVNTFDSLYIENTSAGGVTMGSNVSVTGGLGLYTGILYTNGNTMIVSNNSTNSIQGYSAASYIDGYLTRNVTASGNYDLPVGLAGNFELANINLNATSGISRLTVNFNPFANPATDTILNPGAVYNVYNIITRLLNAGYWTITPDQPLAAGNYTVTLKESGYTNPALDPSAYFVLKRHDNTMPWDATQGIHNPATQTEAGGNVTAVRSAVTGFSDFVIGKVPGLFVLASQVLSFTGQLSGNTAALQWQASNQQQLRYYSVEYSMDGVVYSEVGQIPVTSPEGTAAYAFRYSQLKPGANYFRLGLANNNGNILDYSNIVLLNAAGIRKITVSGSVPSQPKITVNLANTAEVLTCFVSDASGRALLRQGVQQGQQLLDLSALAGGMYFISFYSNLNPVQTEKWLIP